MSKWNKYLYPFRGLAVFALLLPAVALAGEHRLDSEFPLDGASRLVLRAKVADIRVRGADVTQISSQLEAEKNDSGFLFWTSGELTPDELAGIRIEPERRDGELHLRIRVPEKYDDDDLNFDWTLTVPRGLALEIRNAVGDVGVESVAGGVEVTSDVGDVELDVPGGDLGVRVDVGDVSIRMPADALGLLDLESDVGDVEVRVGGRELPAEHPDYGPGARLQTRLGEGAAIRARADVGDIELEAR